MALDVRTKSPAPYQTLVLPQDTQEEEVVSLASSFDNEVDPFAVEQPSEFRPFSEVLDEAQAAYESSYLEQQQASLDSTYASLSDRDKQNLEAYESKMNRSGRDRAAINRDHSKAYSYILQKREIGKDVPELNLAALMRDSKSMAHKRKDVDYYPESSSYRKGANAASEIVTTYLKDNDIPLYQETEEGTRLYLTTGTAAHFAEKPEGHGKWITAGQAGSYSTYWEPKPNLSFLEGMTANPVFRTALAVATGGTSEALIAVGKGLSGETLKTEDWISLAIPALETANVITPPANAATAAQAGTDAMNAANAAGLANAIEIGNAAQAAATSGAGLLGLSYGQTTQLIGAIGNQDPLNAVLAISGNGLITNSLEAIGIPTELANDPDFIEGTTAALETAVAGGNLQDALQDGLVEYITEGGGFGGVPDLDFDGLASVLDPIVEVVENVGDALAPIFDGVEDIAQVVGDVAEDVIIDPADDIIDLLGSEVVDPILQAVEPVVNVIEDVVIDPIDDALDYVGSEVVDPVLQATEDVAQEVGDVIEDYVIDPVDDVLDFVGEEYVDPFAQTIGDVAEDIGQGVGDVVEDVAQVGGDVLEDIGQGVGDVVETVVDAIPSVDLPDIDLPDIDLPDISLPNLGLPSVGLPQGVMPSSPSATRTTDTLFGDMLKFETEITPFQQALIQPQQQQQTTSLPATQQFVNYNNLGQFLQPTQPAEGLITGRRF